MRSNRIVDQVPGQALQRLLRCALVGQNRSYTQSIMIGIVRGSVPVRAKKLTLALAVRRAVAEYGVPSTGIVADHRGVPISGPQSR